MISILQEHLGDALEAPRAVEQDRPSGPSSGTARISMEYAAIHPGDLLAASGPPAFWSDPIVIPARRRVPGLEGVGVIERLAADVDPKLGLTAGKRVALFPVSDLPLFVPRSLTMCGINIGTWGREAAVQRAADISTAIKPARGHAEQFELIGIYRPDEIALAIQHSQRPGKSGNGLLDFRTAGARP